MKHVCNFCGYIKEEKWMKRISVNLVGKPYNICYGCAENFDSHGTWDDAKNDIIWEAYREEGESV